MGTKVSHAWRVKDFNSLISVELQGSISDVHGCFPVRVGNFSLLPCASLPTWNFLVLPCQPANCVANASSAFGVRIRALECRPRRGSMNRTSAASKKSRSSSTRGSSCRRSHLPVVVYVAVAVYVVAVVAAVRPCAHPSTPAPAPSTPAPALSIPPPARIIPPCTPAGL